MCVVRLEDEVDTICLHLVVELDQYSRVTTLNTVDSENVLFLCAF